uniref:Alpha-type protein kinase domain-containing protein n=1 Tax=Globodera pallida TaxID=36090 RepID=A0A183CNV0_GLOPA
MSEEYGGYEIEEFCCGGAKQYGLKMKCKQTGEVDYIFKQQYFNQAPCDVTNERVEREFWRNVIDIDKGVHVKYGADLISSKVGSGFPRREDVVRGVVDARERQQYANHPWNLNNLPKVREIWYGVPGDEAELFDKVMKESAPELFVEQTDLLHQMITHM